MLKITSNSFKAVQVLSERLKRSRYVIIKQHEKVGADNMTVKVPEFNIKSISLLYQIDYNIHKSRKFRRVGINI